MRRPSAVIPLWHAAELLTIGRQRPSFRTMLRALQRPDCPVRLAEYLSPGGVSYPAVRRRDLSRVRAFLGPQPQQLPLPLRRLGPARRRTKT